MTRKIDTPPRPFHLFRHEDPTGVSGTGVVAEGAMWSSGAIALHWPGYPKSTSVWAGLDELLAAHGHDNLTEVLWLDSGDPPPVAPQPPQPQRDGRGWPILGGAVIPLPDDGTPPPPYDERDWP